MGFMNDSATGFKKYKNEQGFTNETLAAKLQCIQVSFGTPVMGKMGKEDAVVYESEALGRFMVYARVNGKNIEVSRVFKKGEALGKNLLKEIAVMAVSDAQAKDTAVADRAVDELGAVIEKLSSGQEVLESNVKTNTVSGESIKYYMQQKVISVKDKYNICDEDQNPKYYVEGSITKLSYSVQTSSGQEIMEIKKKIVAIMPEYSIFVGKNEIGHVKKKMKLTRPEIVGDINGKELNIKGDIAGYHFNIEINGVAVGNVDTERLTWGDCYSIEVLDESMKETIIAIAVICDNALKGK